MNDQLGIVLSGGGVRGMAHIGFLQALEENGISPKFISGASAGALIGGMYAAGREPAEMLEFFKTTPLYKYAFYTNDKPGMMDTDKYYGIYAKYFPTNFSDLNKTLFVTATNLLDGHTTVFSEGDLIQSLLASAALPPLFTPVEKEGKFYADGGIMNNFPIEPLLKPCHQIIGSFSNSVKPISKDDMTWSTKLVKRAAELRFYADAKNKFPFCNYVFEPYSVGQIGLLDTKSIDKAYELGYQEALNEIDTIKAALNGDSKLKASF